MVRQKPGNCMELSFVANLKWNTISADFSEHEVENSDEVRITLTNIFMK